MATNECSRCGSNTNLFLINCRHATVCLQCGKSMAETKEPCSECGVSFTILTKEFPLRLCSDDDKKYYVAAFNDDDVPDFSNEHQWSMIKQSQSSYANAIDAEVLNKDPWILENEAGIKYAGNRINPSTLSKNFLLLREDDSFVLISCADRFSFTRVHTGTQLTTEQAEEKLEKYREHAEETIQKYNKRLRTSQKKPTSTSEKDDSLEKGEHWDHESSCSDDEDVGDTENVHVPSAIKDFQDKDNEAFLSNSGRDMKNILRKVKESDKNDEEEDDD